MYNGTKLLNSLIEEAQDLKSLVANIVICLGELDDSKCAEILKKIDFKIKQLKKADKELIEMSERSIRSGRLEAMGKMAAAISHELRNPLSGIKVAAEYLMKKTADHREVFDIVNNIHNEVIFANNIIANILEYARISKPNMKAFAIKDLVEGALLTVSQQGFFNNIEIKKQFAQDLPLLEVDPLQIRQVFMNLFTNSAEAMLGGGVLEIKAFRENNDAVIEVIDNGCGIDKENQAKLFEPFYSTKPKGIGLGLAICKEIIYNHEGTIGVISKSKKGSTFIVRLPLQREHSENI